MNYYLHLQSLSWKSAFTKKVSFITEVLSMLVNNVLFFVIWWIFFRYFRTVGSWTFSDMATLYAIVSLSYGLGALFLDGARNLPFIVSSGEIDRLLLRPRNTLFSLILSKTRPRGLGDIISTFFYIFVGSIFSPKMLFSILLISLVVTVIIVAIRILSGSLIFWFGRIEEITAKYMDSIHLFAMYPSDIYPFYFRFVLFTIFPAGLIGFLPVELIRDFSWMTCFLFLGAAAFSVTIACLVFYRGLRRYESGYSF
jgi:ABC-2 type transport system permease protein